MHSTRILGSIGEQVDSGIAHDSEQVTGRAPGAVSDWQLDPHESMMPPVAGSQTRAVLSSLALASQVPSGATALTQSVWPARTACCCPVTGSQTRTTGRRRTVGESRLGQTLPQRKLDTQRLFGLSYLVRQVAIYEQCSEGVSGLNKASSGIGQVGVRVGDSGR